MAQAHLVRDALCAAHGWQESAVTIIDQVASGDRVLDRPLADLGGKALWTKELDQGLFDGSIDFAVHSMKDVETIRPPELVIAAMLPRADVRDRLVGADSIAALPHGARLGTSSPRRTAQLLRMRPDLQIVLLRGNVGTRLSKIERGECDATLLAAAGLDRLGMHDIGVAIAVEEMLPAPAQGAIGVELHTQNADLGLNAIDDLATHLCVETERAWLAALGADCHSSVAAYARYLDPKITFSAEIIAPDGRETVARSITIHRADNVSAVRELAAEMLAAASPALRSLFQR